MGASLPPETGTDRPPQTPSDGGRFSGLLRELSAGLSRDRRPDAAADSGALLMHEASNPPRGRIVAAAVVMLALVLAGVLWLGVSLEMLRTEMAGLARSIREVPPPAIAAPDVSADVAALREAVGRLAAKVDALASGDEAKAVARLASEIKSLSTKVDALAAAKAPASKPAAAREEKPASIPRQTVPAPRPIIDPDESSRPFYGPGYPAWPGY